jgi:Holliday junction resolvasome RuvABC ATP-dependent DNA helicase subunit
MRQLRFILPNLYKNIEAGANILIRGPSGFGKTEMAFACCRYLAPNGAFQVFNGESGLFIFPKRVVFIDEIHTVPLLERLYHTMDEKRHVLIFASNHDGNLPEAFVNRCFDFILDDYTEEELILIARESSDFIATDAQFLDIVDAGNRNPRIIKSLCLRLGVYFAESNIRTVNNLNFATLISDIFRINNGLDTLCVRYIETLQSIGGTGSLSLIKSILHVDESSIKNSVEPVLLKKNIIRITPKGRTLITND